MVCLHLYNTVDFAELYKPLIYIGEYPLIYYISFTFDICVPIYSFLTGYGLFVKRNITIKSAFKKILTLLVGYWVILLLTCLTGVIMKHPVIQGDVWQFLANAMILNYKTYVGAWWYLTIYALLLILSPLVIKLVDKVKWWIVLPLSGVVYAVAYYFRMMNPLKTGVEIADWVINILVLFGTTQLGFIVGMIFYKHKIISYLREKIGMKTIVGLVIIAFCFVAHSIVKSMIIAPVIAVMFIVGFSLLKLNKPIEKVLLYFGKHSTNIWLVHMQLYSLFFANVVFCTNTVVGCFVILIAMCLVLSYFVDFTTKPLLKIVNKKA